MALAVRRRRRAGAVHALDPAQRARAADLDRAPAPRVRDEAAEPVQGDLRARADRRGRCASSRSARAVQFAYWGIFFWLPPFLARPVEQGGAGMGVVGSLQWIISVQVGAYLGYLTFGFIADRLGRRRTFILFMLCAAALVPIYGQMARSPMVLLLLGPAARLLRPRLLQHVRRLRRGAVSDGRARDGAGHELQRRPHGRRDRAVYDRRGSRRCPVSASALRSASRRRSSCGRAARVHAARPQRPGARVETDETSNIARGRVGEAKCSDSTEVFGDYWF